MLPPWTKETSTQSGADMIVAYMEELWCKALLPLCVYLAYILDSTRMGRSTPRAISSG